MAGRFSYSASDRNHSTPWFKIGELAVTTSVLVAGIAVFSMVVWAIDASLLRPFVLIADDVRRGQVWRLVTWPLVNTPQSIWTILTIALFWYFGREIEGLLGRNRFAWFLFLVTVVPAVVGAVIGVNVWGLEYLQLAVILVFIAEFPNVRFFFNIPGWVIGLVIVGLQVLNLVGTRNTERLFFLFVLLATAAVLARSFGLISSLHFIPQLPLPEVISGTSSSGPRRSSKGKVRGNKSRGRGKGRGKGKTVVEGPWSVPKPPVPAESSPNASAAQAELDALLDKISAGGLDSLTDAEKRRLNELSKRLR